MQKIVALIFLLFSGMAAVSQDSVWYQAFTGKIDRYSITLHLQKAGGEYSGFYYYHSSKLPIELTRREGYENLRLVASSRWDRSAENSAEEFVLSLKGDSLNGTWQSTDSSRKLAVKLARLPAPPFTFQYWEVTGETKLRPGKDNSPEAHFDAGILWPVGKHPALPALRKAIATLINTKETIAAPRPHLEKERDRFLEDYRQEFREVPDSDWMEFPGGYNYSLSQNMHIVYFSGKWVSLGAFWHSYSGGAHGNYGSKYLCFDIIRQRPLQLKDILTPQGIAAAPALMAKNLRKQLGLMNDEPLTEAGLFENEIPVTENFYLTDTGIAFSYSPYEIGPYAMGEIEIFLTFGQLKAYLKMMDDR